MLKEATTAMLRNERISPTARRAWCRLRRSGRAARRAPPGSGAKVRWRDASTAESSGWPTATLRRNGLCLGREDPRSPRSRDLAGAVEFRRATGAVRGAERGIPVRSELEPAGGPLCAPVVAITGTNGKTTTTGEFRATGARPAATRHAATWARRSRPARGSARTSSSWRCRASSSSFAKTSIRTSAQC